MLGSVTGLGLVSELEPAIWVTNLGKCLTVWFWD